MSQNIEEDFTYIVMSIFLYIISSFSLLVAVAEDYQLIKTICFRLQINEKLRFLVKFAILFVLYKIFILSTQNILPFIDKKIAFNTTNNSFHGFIKKNITENNRYF